DLTAALVDANGGRRVDTVLEMTGGTVTDQSLRALAPFGRLAFYGMASRTEPSPVRPAALLAHSTTISGMWLAHVFQLPGDRMRGMLDDLFGLAIGGRLRVVEGGEYGLAEARRAHEDLRARRTIGKLVLDPSR
ncbi:MAG: zinc-binding dehydrogenase, partial [Spirillospora sp.]